MRRPEEVQVFVRRRGGSEFLVLHRSPSQGSYWHPVSGGLEEGEDAERAARRELQEEIGLAGAELRPERHEYGYPAAEEPSERQAQWPPGTDWIAVTGFLVDAPANFEPKLNWEHDDYRWCSRDEALQLFHWPDVAAALEALLA